MAVETGCFLFPVISVTKGHSKNFEGIISTVVVFISCLQESTQIITSSTLSTVCTIANSGAQGKTKNKISED